MKVSLFVTCIVDQLYPGVGVAATGLLRGLGIEVAFNPAQTCCGQPAFNAGHLDQAREVAVPLLDILEKELQSSDFVVTLSGSCATMVKKFYRELFAGEDSLQERAEAVAARMFELSQFLVDVVGTVDVGADYRGRVTYHDSCHLLRELGVQTGPRDLLARVRGCEFVEMDRAEACCGFGGIFSVNYPEISTAIAEEKLASIERSGADTVVACDAGCLMQIAGLLGRRNVPVRCLHIAEILASRGPQ